MSFPASADAGREFVVEAYGCPAAALTSVAAMQTLFDAVIDELGLHPLAPATWHRFPAPGGVTGVVVLAESHLTCHTFPEHGSLCLNLFCCRPRAEWDFAGRLADLVGATDVRVRVLTRAHAAAAATTAVVGA